LRPPPGSRAVFFLILDFFFLCVWLSGFRNPFPGKESLFSVCSIEPTTIGGFPLSGFSRHGFPLFHNLAPEAVSFFFFFLRALPPATYVWNPSTPRSSFLDLVLTPCPATNKFAIVQFPGVGFNGFCHPNLCPFPPFPFCWGFSNSSYRFLGRTHAFPWPPMSPCDPALSDHRLDSLFPPPPRWSCSHVSFRPGVERSLLFSLFRIRDFGSSRRAQLSFVHVFPFL